MIFADLMTDFRILVSIVGGCFGLLVGAAVMGAIVAGQRPKEKQARPDATPRPSPGVKVAATVARFLFKRYLRGRSR